MTGRNSPEIATGDGVTGAVDDVAGQVRQFFATAVPGAVVAPDDDYFALGLVNSLLALELVTFVEQRFRISVDVDDLDLDNFRTMNRLIGFVRRKRAAAGR